MDAAIQRTPGSSAKEVELSNVGPGCEGEYGVLIRAEFIATVGWGQVVSLTRAEPRAGVSRQY